MDKVLLANLPEDPGVYLMKNRDGQVIYVGKAKILKNRVKQYFLNTKSHSSKVRAMVSNIDSFEYIITDSEMEALILECNLIKKYRPYYNILLKDDKNFPYIKVTLNEEYPKLIFTRKLIKDGAKYYGPYTSTFAVRETIDMVSKLYKIPDCNIKLPHDMGKKKECLNSHIEQCIAPCSNAISKYEYRKIISEICRFLDGNHDELKNELTHEMQKASDELLFERAALLRNKIDSIKKIEEKQKIISERQADEDIIGFYRLDRKTFAEVFFVRSGRLIGRHSDIINNTEDDSDEVLGADFLKQFYGDSSYIPKNIYISCESDEYSLLSQWLTLKSGRKVNIIHPKRGRKWELVSLACKNAHQASVNYLLKNTKAKKALNKTLIALSQELGISGIIRRIEAYDISNTSGSENVGSMIVFTDGKPTKSSYRKFKIDTVIGPDDYKSMSEMVYRRFRRAKEEEILISRGEMEENKSKFLPRPDCIFIDGGKGHVSVISELLELIDEDIPIFGMVKDDRHRTRALVSPDGNEIELKLTSDIFSLVASIQDEVHRFAIGYHKKIRTKNMISSELLKIEGVGEATAKKIFRHFKTISAVKLASLDEIKQIQGIPSRTAENIFNFFHKIS